MTLIVSSPIDDPVSSGATIVEPSLYVSSHLRLLSRISTTRFGAPLTTATSRSRPCARAGAEIGSTTSEYGEDHVEGRRDAADGMRLQIAPDRPSRFIAIASCFRFGMGVANLAVDQLVPLPWSRNSRWS